MADKVDVQKVFENTGKIIRANMRTFVIASVIMLVVYSFLYGLWLLPIVNLGFTRTSIVGIADILYIIAVAVLSAVLLVLIKQKAHASRQSKLGGFGGIFAGFVAAACPACQGITLVALGSTAAFIPLGALSSFVWAMQLVALFILWISVYLVSVSVYTKTCSIVSIGQPSIKSSFSGPHLLDNNKFFASLAIVTVLVIANQFLLSTSGLVSASSSGSTVTLSGGFSYGPKLTLKPMPLATGEQPRIAGYKSIVKAIPTISELEMRPSTGDVIQDIIANMVPKGTPWYGQEAGVSFDDPVKSLELWARATSIKLTPDQEARWNRIAGSFTCDFCCGSPQQPTIITRCGCAHARAAQGIARWFIQNYGDKYADEEIYGEMARWFAAWYPGTMIKRIALEMGG